MFRQYVREVANYLRPYQLLTFSITGPILVFGIGCLLLGFEAALSWASDLVPLTFAVISVLVSVKKLRDEHQTVVITFVLVLGLLGSMVMHFSRMHDQTRHQGEVRDLRNRMDSVRDQNGQLLTAFLKPAPTAQEAELERRQNIEKTLRSEYILSHDHVSPSLLVGTEFPPDDWMNKRLEELGEKWTIASSEPMAMTIPLRSFVVFDGTPRFEKKGDNGQVAERDMKIGDMFSFNIHFKQDGPNPVEIAIVSFKGYEEPDMTPETTGRTVQTFKTLIRQQQKDSERKTSTLSRGQGGFNTAFITDDQNHLRYLTQDDLRTLQLGNGFALVLAQIDYLDGSKIHHARLCYRLQPPATTMPRVWQSCLVDFGKSD
jgi:hypothetical protein